MVWGAISRASDEGRHVMHMQERSVASQPSGTVSSILDATLGSPVSQSDGKGSPEVQEAAQFGPTQVTSALHEWKSAPGADTLSFWHTLLLWQVVLGGGALLLAAIFVVTSFGDFGQPAKQASAPVTAVCPSTNGIQNDGHC